MDAEWDSASDLDDLDVSDCGDDVQSPEDMDDDYETKSDDEGDAKTDDEADSDAEIDGGEAARDGTKPDYGLPFVSKYERVAIIIQRANELERGAKPKCPPEPGFTNYDQACFEYDNGLLEARLVRYMAYAPASEPSKTVCVSGLVTPRF